MKPDLARVPGYRRTTRVVPGNNAVAAMMEDDMHCMAVVLRHDGRQVTAIEPNQARAPWTTCPGAEAELVSTFTGCPLGEVSVWRERLRNCTHLHDLAVLAAAHMQSTAPVRYEMFVSDPDDGRRELEIRRDGVAVWQWSEQDGRFTAPAAIAGQTAFTLRDWIATLPPSEREAARLLQTAAVISHGRTMPLSEQSDATRMAPSCHTFQPEQAAVAKRIRLPVDFSSGGRQPLEGFAESVLASLQAAD